MARLTVEDVLVIHAMVIEATGGSHGVRDPHLLASLVEKPFAVFSGNELYASVWLKAAVLLEAAVNYHVFVDGNKRTGITIAARFLALEGYELSATNEELVALAVSVATKEIGIEPLARWLEAHASTGD